MLCSIYLILITSSHWIFHNFFSPPHCSTLSLNVFFCECFALIDCLCHATIRSDNENFSVCVQCAANWKRWAQLIFEPHCWMIQQKSISQRIREYIIRCWAMIFRICQLKCLAHQLSNVCKALADARLLMSWAHSNNE